MDTPEAHDAFTHGYLIAVSNLINLHDEPTIAEDVLRELGETEAVIKRLDLCEYDAKPLRKLFREIKRREKYELRRAMIAERNKRDAQD